MKGQSGWPTCNRAHGIGRHRQSHAHRMSIQAGLQWHCGEELPRYLSAQGHRQVAHDVVQESSPRHNPRTCRNRRNLSEKSKDSRPSAAKRLVACFLLRNSSNVHNLLAISKQECFLCLASRARWYLFGAAMPFPCFLPPQPPSYLGSLAGCCGPPLASVATSPTLPMRRLRRICMFMSTSPCGCGMLLGA